MAVVITEKDLLVTPYAGVWIEIRETSQSSNKCSSLPTRECGLKSVSKPAKYYTFNVTPYAGVWIEINGKMAQQTIKESLPTRECGLKSANLSDTMHI